MSCTFGKTLRENEFMLDNKGIFLNHGSYGVVPRRVFEKQIKLRHEMEALPDNWYKRRNIALFRQNVPVLCKLINSKYEDTVFVENVTFGLNSVLRSLKWNSGDGVLLSNLQYHSLTIMCEDLEERYGTTTEFATVDFPIKSQEQMLQAYREKLEKHPNIKLAILDHVSSPSSILVPVKKLSDLCHEFGVLTMVDGANALGQVKVDVQDLDVDFYSGNIHKWMFTPRGAGYLWINPKHAGEIKPAVVSHFHGDKLHYNFCVRGTRDDTPYYTLPDAVQFLEDIGGRDAIYKHNTELLGNAINKLEAAWNTTRFQLPEDMTCPFVRLIKVPDMKNYPKTPVGGKALEDDLYERFHIQVLCQHMPGDEIYFRISGHVYNTPEDYDILRDAVLTLMNEPERKQEEPKYQLAMMHWELNPLDE